MSSMFMMTRLKSIFLLFAFFDVFLLNIASICCLQKYLCRARIEGILRSSHIHPLKFLKFHKKAEAFIWTDESNVHSNGWGGPTQIREIWFPQGREQRVKKYRLEEEQSILSLQNFLSWVVFALFPFFILLPH